MPRRRRRLGEIIRAMRTDADLDQTQLAERVNEITGHEEGRGRVTQPRISDLERNSEPIERDVANLVAIDEACGFEPGHSLIAAGLVQGREVDLETAIQTFPAPIDDRDRAALLAILRVYVVRGTGDEPVTPSPRTPGMTRAEEELARAKSDRARQDAAEHPEAD